MVFFKNKEFMPIFKKMRPTNLHNKTVFIELEFEEFYTYKNLYNEFNQTYKLDQNPNIANVPLYIVWAEKCMFVKKAIEKNYFNSKCFYWVDAGYFRESEKEFERYINNWPSTKKCFEDDRLIMGQVKDFTEDEKQKIVNFDKNALQSLKTKTNVAGGFFGGQIKNSLKFVDLYYDTIKLFFKKNIFFGQDQHVFTYMAFAHPEIMKLIRIKEYLYFRFILYYK